MNKLLCKYKIEDQTFSMVPIDRTLYKRVTSIGIFHKMNFTLNS